MYQVGKDALPALNRRERRMEKVHPLKIAFLVLLAMVMLGIIFFLNITSVEGASSSCSPPTASTPLQWWSAEIVNEPGRETDSGQIVGLPAGTVKVTVEAHSDAEFGCGDDQANEKALVTLNGVLVDVTHVDQVEVKTVEVIIGEDGILDIFVETGAVRGPGSMFVLVSVSVELDEEPRNGGKPPKRTCPDCGSPYWETIPEGGVKLSFYSRGLCVICEDGSTNLEVWARLEGFVYFEVFYKNELLQSRSDGQTMAGEVWRLEFKFTWLDDHQDFSVWSDYANGVRIRDVAPFAKYIVCSDAPGFDDIDIDGVAHFQPGHQKSDWAQVVLNNGYLDDKEYPGDAALAWADQLKEEGSLALPE